MKILFHLGHPAHFHLFKNVIRALKQKGHEVFILIKKKDVLESLVKSSGWSYTNILESGRKDTKLGVARGMILQDLRLLRFCRQARPDLLIGTSFAISHVGKLLGIPSINVNEDDADVVPLYAQMAYPWASVILSPSVCRNGKWKNKTIRYQGYHELAYLHPNHFKANRQVAEKYIHEDTPFCVMRFAKLTAHHDDGIRGIGDQMALKLIQLIVPKMKVIITSERALSPSLEPYRIAVNPQDMHDLMASASMYIGDSQTMAAEAGVLGIPFIRYNDFVGRISYLDELENTYELGYGIKPGLESELISRVKTLLSKEELTTIWKSRREKMLADKTDLAEFMVRFIEGYPKNIELFQDSSVLEKMDH